MERVIRKHTIEMTEKNKDKDGERQGDINRENQMDKIRKAVVRQNESCQ